MFEAAFLGTSGSSAYNNGSKTHYGTNTLCVAVRVNGHTLIFDAGSGICGLSKLQDYQNERFHLFLSHYHADHLEGLLFWNALFDIKQQISVYGDGTDLGDVRSTLEQYLKTPFFPVGMDVFRAGVDFYSVKAGDEIVLEGGVTVKTVRLSHPGGCLGYRVSYGGKSLCYLTDVELYDHENDEEFHKFVQDCDILIIDSFFKDGESIKGWGHSMPRECAQLAKQANAKQLALAHYGPSFNDEDIRMLEESAKEVFHNSFAAADGLRISVE